MFYDHLTDSAIACNNVDNALGNTRLATNISEEKSGQRSILRRLQDHSIAHSNRRRDLPRQHQQGEIPRDNLSANAQRLSVRQLAFHQLRHARMIVKMPLHEGDINVATLADRLAVVEGLKHRKKAAVFLQQTGNRVKYPRPPMASEFLPFGLGFACRLNGQINVGGTALSKRSQRLSVGRVTAQKALARFGKCAVDKVPKPRAIVGDPCKGLRRALGRFAVFHALKNLFNCHVFTPPHDGMRPSRLPSHNVPTVARYRPRDLTHQSGKDRAEASGRPVPLSSSKDRPNCPSPC